MQQWQRQQQQLQIESETRRCGKTKLFFIIGSLHRLLLACCCCCCPFYITVKIQQEKEVREKRDCEEIIMAAIETLNAES